MNKYTKQPQKKYKQSSFWNNVFSNEEKKEATEVVDQNLPSLSEIRVEDIAIPKADIIAASDDMSSEELSEIFRKYSLSIESLIQRGRNPNEEVPVIITTHETDFNTFQSVMEDLSKSKELLNKPVCMKII